MNRLLLLSCLSMALALPHGHQEYEPAIASTIISQGPWVAAEEAWPEEAVEGDRDGKGIVESLPSPASLLARLGNWWSWDR